jgi:hypothetical protein
MPFAQRTIPNKEEEDVVSINYIPTQEEQALAQRIHPRIQVMLDDRQPHLVSMRRSVLQTEGVSVDNPNDPRDEQIVMPMARAFNESKLSEIMAVGSTFTYAPVNRTEDEWRARIFNDLKDHHHRKTMWSSKEEKVKRAAIMMGVGIVRTGYRLQYRIVKDRVIGEKDGRNMHYIERKIPVYDDLFTDLVSPFDFFIDPNATSINDAADCGQTSTMSVYDFQEIFGSMPNFKNIEAVVDSAQKGVGVSFDDKGNMMTKNASRKDEVRLIEYFHKNKDQWYVMANGIQVSPDDNPLAEDSKELPFVSWHNDESYIKSSLGTKLVNGKTKIDINYNSIMGKPSFWTKGDPAILHNLIDLYTGFFRVAIRTQKLSSESIVATMGNFRPDTSRPWRHGDPVVGGMGKMQVMPLGNSNLGSIDAMISMLFQQMILAVGTDPRSLTDSSAKTATQSAIERETSTKRLAQLIRRWENESEMRLGNLLKNNMMQYYDKPEVVALTGAEDEEELATFTEVTEEDGFKFGKRLRKIQASMAFDEGKTKRKDGTYKYYLTEDPKGETSFLARPEYIRASDVYVTTSSERDIAQIRAIQVEQAQSNLRLFMELIPLAQPDQGGNILVKQEDLPNIKEAIKSIVIAGGGDPDKQIGNTEEEKPLQDKRDLVAQMQQERNPISDTPQLDEFTNA